MDTIHDAGRPLDTELPYLDPDQIDSLVDQLIGSPRAAAEAIPLSVDPPTRPRPRWRRPVGLAAAVAGIVALTATVITDRVVPSPGADTGISTPVVQAPAPAFDCWAAGSGSPTVVAAYLPWIDAPASVGRTKDSVCFQFPDNGGGTGGQLGASREMVPFFSSSFDVTRSNVAFGLIDPTVTQVEFDPNDTTSPIRPVASFVAVGSLNAFSLPYDGSGTFRFYVGSRLVVEKPVVPMMAQQMVNPEVTATGLPCDPTVNYSRVNAAYLTLDDPNTDAMFGEVYLEALDPENPAPAADRPLCLLVQSSGPQLSAAATSDDPTAPLAYLASTKADGGTFIWGSLTGSAINLIVTDESGRTTPLSAASRDDTRTGWVPFIVFVPDGAPRLTSVQPVDTNDQPVGMPRPVV